jgi:hypothetical protein
MNAKEELTKLLMESYDKGVEDAVQAALEGMQKAVLLEREACANLLDSTDLSAMSADPKLQNWTAALLFQYAAAIRARGETK